MIKQTEHSVLRSNELSMCILYTKSESTKCLNVDDKNVSLLFLNSLFDLTQQSGNRPLLYQAGVLPINSSTFQSCWIKKNCLRTFFNVQARSLYFLLF